MRWRWLPWTLLLAPRLWAQADPVSEARTWIEALTAQEMHGRGYVQGGDSIAAEWVAERFRAFGLQALNGQWFQPFVFPVNTFPEPLLVEVGGRRAAPGTEFLVDPASGPAKGRFPLVRLRPEDLATPDRRNMTVSAVMGNAVLLEAPQGTSPDTLRMLRAWEQELLRYAPVVRKATGNKLTWSVAGNAARHASVEVLPQLLPDSVTELVLDIPNRFVPRHHARNVFGVLQAKGGRSKDWLVVSAHYDHLGRMGPDALFPGANDNASGVAMMLSLAQALAQEPLRVNVLFIAFAGEEAGLHGSTAFVEAPPLPLDRIRMVLNLDLNGTGEEGIMVVNATAQKKAYKDLVRINAKHGKLPAVKARGPACNSDHCPFVLRGVPGVFIYTLGGVAHYHDVFDQPATLSLAGFNGLRANLLAYMRSYR